jgi:hypothetical protein
MDRKAQDFELPVNLGKNFGMMKISIQQRKSFVV